VASIEIEGFEELEEFLQNLTVTDSDEKKAMKLAIDVIANEVEKNTPERTGKLKRIKKTVKKDGFGTVGTIKMGVFYDIFQEFGSSQQKKNIGFFERSVNNTKDKAIQVLTKELLDKAK